MARDGFVRDFVALVSMFAMLYGWLILGMAVA
jgi:hypothetical protein